MAYFMDFYTKKLTPKDTRYKGFKHIHFHVPVLTGNSFLGALYLPRMWNKIKIKLFLGKDGYGAI